MECWQKNILAEVLVQTLLTLNCHILSVSSCELIKFKVWLLSIATLGFSNPILNW